MGHQQNTDNKGQSFIDLKNKSYTWVSYKASFPELTLSIDTESVGLVFFV